jgi:tRNA pseudouridine32 synthase/23S rRNA pseudouridine746 synthase
MSVRQSQKKPSPLPSKNGVHASFLWLPPGQWPNLLTFLLDYFPNVARETWLARIAKQELLAQNGQPLQADSPYVVGMQIFYYREIAAETPIPFAAQVLHIDQHLLVVDKPHFLPVIPSGRFLQETLLVRLRQEFDLPHLTPLHRLDRETAGIVLLSTNPATRGQYQVLFQQQAVSKTYEAIAAPMPQREFPFLYASRIEKGDPFFCMREAEGEPNAQTWVDVLARGEKLWHYQLRPLTGRTHQLRVHMAALGSPILHDGFYPHALPCKGDDFSSPLQLLARKVSFTDPLSGEQREFLSQRCLLGE